MEKEQDLINAQARLRQLEAEQKDLEHMLKDNDERQHHQCQIIAAHEAMLNVLRGAGKLSTEEVFDRAFAEAKAAAE